MTRWDAKASDICPALVHWTGPLGLPDFARIGAADYEPAFEVALAQHAAEVSAIAEQVAPPTFENTVAALERSGALLRKVAGVFFNLVSADGSDELQAVELAMAPVLSRHESSVYANRALFARVDALFAKRDALAVSPEQSRTIEVLHRRFLRAGAHLDDAARGRLAAIDEALAELGVRFAQNVLADEAAFALVIDDEDDLEGISESLRAAMATAAEERGHTGKHAVTLARSIVEPFLAQAARRSLREAVFRAWTTRGESGSDTDNRAIVRETLRLRAERAHLLGFESYASFALADTMARSPEAVRSLLSVVWERAVERAREEEAALARWLAGEGESLPLQGWDWRYYAEKERAARYDVDEQSVKPYFELERTIAAAFATAQRLFGVHFAARPDVVAYHPDVRVFEVKDAEGRPVGVFLGDYFARATKRSGAWMNELQGQHGLDGGQRPIVLNVLNFAKSAPGEPILLSLDDARTLFHELGHALHGLLSEVAYPSIAGTSVLRDFVELPSQLFEHWLLAPSVLAHYARHVGTGEVMPLLLRDKLVASRTFNAGFAAVEYTSCAIVDLELHADPAAFDGDPIDFEAHTLARIGMPAAIAMRHRTPHFAHVFAGDGYAAGYYGYLWSEVLDADAFQAFEEAGDLFDPDVAGRLRRHIYAAGGSQEPAQAYIAFRGRLPTPDAMLRKRGLA